MKKVDKTVIKETRYIGAWILIFSALMQSVFLIIGKWDYTVLLGNLLSAGAGTLNFFLLGLTVTKALESDDEKYRKTLMRMSQALRLFFVFLVALLGALPMIPCFNIWATLIPIFFPRIAIMIRPFFMRLKGYDVYPNTDTEEGDNEQE
ncbi:MAG: hypothetical protein IJY41_00310 [Clostridia bacterium]|nr:hypothetical protein [Clostridia bacterium]